MYDVILPTILPTSGSAIQLADRPASTPQHSHPTYRFGYCFPCCHTWRSFFSCS